MADEPNELDARARRSAEAVRALAARIASGAESLDDLPPRTLSADHRGPRRVRILLVAAAILGVCALGVFALTRSADTARLRTAESAAESIQSEVPASTGDLATTSSAIESTSTLSSASPSATTTTVDGPAVSVAPVPDGCDSANPPNAVPVEDLPTFMTMAPGPPTLEYTLSASPTTVCVGGTVTFTITIHNSGSDDAQVTPRLVMTQMLPHIGLASAASEVVEAGRTATIVQPVVIPQLKPGPYVIVVYGYGASASIDVVEPPPPGTVETAGEAPTATDTPVDGPLPVIPGGIAQNLHAIDESTAWLVTDRVIAHTSDGGQTWQTHVARPICPTNGACVPGRDFELDSSHAWVTRSNLDGGNDVTVMRTSDGLRTVSTSTIDVGFANGIPIGVVFLDSLHGFVSVADPSIGAPAESGQGALFRTSDGGASFEPVADHSPVPVAFDDPLNGWGVGQGLFHTVDGANTWTRLTPPGWDATGADPNGPSYQIIATSTGRTVIKIYKSQGLGAGVSYLATDDQGQTWADVSPPNTSEVNNTGPQSTLMTATATDWFGIQQTQGDDATLWASADGGATYTGRGLPFPALNVAMATPRTGWLTTASAIRRTLDGGASWTTVANIIEPVTLSDGCVWQPSFTGHDGAGGTELTWIELTNASDQTCKPPEIVAIRHDTSDGVGTFSATEADTAIPLPPLPSSVGPDDSVSIQLTTTVSTDPCGEPSRPIHDIDLTLATAAGDIPIRVPIALTIETACLFAWSIGGTIS
jgi:uncharacterized repeat protein (TIGR01451 family)